MPFPASRPAGALLACALLLGGCGNPQALPETRIAGVVTTGALSEISGISASRRHDDVLWAVEDGGNPASIHALARHGRRLATFRVEGARNTDWEDIAGFKLDGRHYLMVADTGDNGGVRKTLSLHVFAEPDAFDADGTLRPAWTVEFRWPDGARDCEAIAVDPLRNEILLLTKKRQPPQVYTLPLQPASGNGARKSRKVLTARLAGTLAGVPQASAEERRANPSVARLRSQVTAADISPQRDAIAVLTYSNLLVYPRRKDQSWPQALAHPPLVVRMTLLPQPEAVSFSSGGHGIFATGEFSPAPILYLPYERTSASATAN